VQRLPVAQHPFDEPAQLVGLERRIPILAMTAYATRQDVERCTLVGMNGHIAKPIDRRTLLGAIRSHAGRPPAAAAGSSANVHWRTSSSIMRTSPMNRGSSFHDLSMV
jgi:DNA-binding response OmpR family regulator